MNAGCRITSIQAFLGHKKLNTTMIYARAYAAMWRIEQRLVLGSQPEPVSPPVEVGGRCQLLTLAEQLIAPELTVETRLAIAIRMRRVLSGEAVPAGSIPVLDPVAGQGDLPTPQVFVSVDAEAV